MEAVVQCQRVGLRFPKGAPVFEDVSFSLDAGTFHFLTGASGAGKSSLLRLLYLGAPPSVGRLFLLGEEVTQLPPAARPFFLHHIGVVFQDFRLLNHMTALENVALALKVRGVDVRQRYEQAAEILKWVGLGDHLKHYPYMLSGGQQQRIAIARAVITRPRVLLADEPTGNVDDDIAMRLLYLLEELHKSGTTVLIATHNRALAREFPYPELHLADQTLYMVGSSGTLQKPIPAPSPTPRPFGLPSPSDRGHWGGGSGLFWGGR